MNQYAWNDCPVAAKDQVLKLVRALQETLSPHLVGIYLHGSLAIGCFNPAQSDVDVLALSDDRLSVQTKRDMARVLTRLSLSPYPIEISILRKEGLEPWRHPTPYEMHYSEDWRERYEDDLASGNWRNWNAKENEDADLAAHVTITLHRGVRLAGAPIREVFPAVSREDYVASLLNDAHWALDRLAENPVYAVLNTCRVCAYLREGRILSKDEGGQWALEALPVIHRPVLSAALHSYRGTGAAPPPDEVALQAFAEYMRTELRRLHGVT